MMRREIRYTKNGVREESDRTIIPTYIPTHTMKALDITGLPESEQERLSNLYADYQMYYQQRAEQIFNFEDWISHTERDSNDQVLKWRSFVLENTEFVG